MRISDWSSDVCSSDLVPARPRFGGFAFSSASAAGMDARMACSSAVFAEGTPAASMISPARSEEHTSELQSLMRSSYAVFCLKKTTLTLDYGRPAIYYTITTQQTTSH